MRNYTAKELFDGACEGKQYRLGTVDIVPVGIKENSYVINFRRMDTQELIGQFECDANGVVKCEEVVG